MFTNKTIRPSGTVVSDAGCCAVTIGNKRNRTVICMELKAKANDKRKNLALSRDGFQTPRSNVTGDHVA
ncbi:hypothetical protein TNCV_1586501 [Trichonephila clavipes]|nr:hypothetical protein TNCV_1586501 [Trichonephila clavipes]